MLTFLMLVAAMTTSLKPGELKSFEDWAVGCDNGRACAAVSLMEMEAGENQLTLQITRAPAADAAAELRIPNIEQELPGAPVLLVVDNGGANAGKRAIIARARLPRDDGPLSLVVDRALVAGLRAGSRLELETQNGQRLGSASLRGLIRALTYMDEQQGRAKTLTALAVPGPAVPTSVPAAPALPTILTLRPPKPAVMPLSENDVQSLQARIGCDGMAKGALPAEAVKIDGRNWLALVPCSMGPYNVVTAPILISGKGKSRKMKPASFDFGPGFSQAEGLPLLSNANWDATKGELSSFAKGRGLGDCGSAETYVWDGRQFRLVTQIAMAECRGVLDWIPTWRANVTRR